MKPLLLLLLGAGLSVAADRPPVPRPKPTRGDEPVARSWSAAKAAVYLDGVGVNWTRDRRCVTCHTNMPYLFARPLVKGAPDAGWKEVRQFLEDDVTSWGNGGKPRGDAYLVATAAALAVSDARTTGKLHPATKTALDRMWSVQREGGDWNWLKCDWPPLEHDDYYGAVLAAVAVGEAPGQYAKSDQAKAGIKKLRAYFAKTPSPDLHHSAWLLWAASKVDGLVTVDQTSAAVAELKKAQRKDGGWCLPGLGKYDRRDKSANDPNAESDGYATGLVVFALRQAGVRADDPAVADGVKWLKSHQRESGRWYTRSLNNDRAHFITNAGTALAVMALDACGENPVVR
jgi:squalene-hopene/tetraprenyl-beta-curcumene cyclase